MKIYAPLLLTAAAVTLATGAFAEGYNTNNTGSQMNNSRSYNNTNQSESRLNQSNARNNIVTSTQLSSMDVENIQESLRNEGYSLTVDGVWGQQTTAAIRSFQRDNNLNETGMLDAQTLAELDVDINTSR